METHVKIEFNLTDDQADLVPLIVGVIQGTHTAVAHCNVKDPTEWDEQESFSSAPAPKPARGEIKRRFIESLIDWPGQYVTVQTARHFAEQAGGCAATGDSYIQKMADDWCVEVYREGVGRYRMPASREARLRFRNWKTT